MSAAPARERAAAKPAEAIVEGRLELTIAEVDREEVASILSGLLLAILQREAGRDRVDAEPVA
jgi:hypothetical protein